MVDQKQYDNTMARTEAQGVLRDRGMRSKRSFFNEDRDECCEFCRQPLPTSGEWKLDTERCSCPEAVENDTEYDRQMKIVLEEKITERQQARIKANKGRSGITKLFESRTFANFTETPDNAAALQLATKYAAEFEPESGKGLLFSGPVGTGKTHLAAAVAIAVMEQQYTVTFGTAHTLLSEIRYTFGGSDPDGERNVMKRYMECDLLVIDDLGKEKTTDWTIDVIFEIVNARYEACKPVVITTNLDLTELREKYRENGEAIVDRLLEMCKGVRVKGESWRRKSVG